MSIPVGGTTVEFSPAEFPVLRLRGPRLWWPNGYGTAELYDLRTTFVGEGAPPVEKAIRFGVREVTYELSLLDNGGALRCVEYDLTVGRRDARSQMDVTHEGIREVPGGWAASTAAGADASPVFHPVADTRATPFLTIKRTNSNGEIVKAGFGWVSCAEDTEWPLSRWGKLEPCTHAPRGGRTKQRLASG